MEASGSFHPAFLVSGMHLAPQFGESVRLIEDGNYRIAGIIDNLLASDRPASRGKSAAILLQGLMDKLSAAPPDFLVVVGDREEAIAGALAGAICAFPWCRLPLAIMPMTAMWIMPCVMQRRNWRICISP